MKKIIFMLMAAALVLSAAACSSQMQAANADLIRAYAYNAEDIVHCSSVILHEDGTFVFHFSAISSYMGHGEYTVENDVVTLFTDDGEYHYTFRKKGDTLIFDAAHSSENLWFGEFTDGSVFA